MMTVMDSFDGTRLGYIQRYGAHDQAPSPADCRRPSIRRKSRPHGARARGTGRPGRVTAAGENDDIAEVEWHDGKPVAKTLLFPDLGPVIRYSGLVAGPGDEPHEVFTLTGCTP